MQLSFPAAGHPYGARLKLADGGPITTIAAAAPMPAPYPAPRPVSPYSIRGIASAVGGAYDAARGATTNGFEALQHTFGRPVGYEPAPVNPQPAPSPVVSQVAAPAPQPAAVPQLGGLNLNALQRREAAAGLANGGRVRRRGPVSALAGGGKISGPGTGTSDSIPISMDVGSYVMPADSTQNLQQQPVNVSNGETAYSPEQVHAVGLAALDAMRDVTHKKVRAKGRANGGPISRMGYADGGQVDNNVRAVLPPPIGSQLAAQIPTGGDRPVSMVDQIPTGGDRPAAAAGPVTAIAGAGPAPSGAAGGGRGFVSPPAADPNAPQAPISSMVPGAPGVAKFTTMGGATPAYTNVPASAADMLTPRGPISAQNDQAANALAARSLAAAVAGVPSAAANLPAGYGVTTPQDTGGVGILDKGYQDARAARMDGAADAQAADQMGKQGAQMMGTQATNQTTLAAEGMREAGAMARTGVEQSGALQRTQAQIASQQALEGPLHAAQTAEAQQHITQGQAALDAQAAYQKALAGGDPKQIDAAELALRGVSGHLPLRYETGQGGSMGADATHNIAIQYLNGDHSVLSALGSGTIGAMNRSAVMQQVAEEMKNRGYAPEQVNAMRLNFLGDQAGSTVAGKRTTQIDIAAGEAGNALQLVRQYSANVPRTQFQPLNRALNAYRTNTGDPATVQLGAAMNTLVNAYSRAISPTGTPTVSDKQHAEALLNSAQTPEQTEGVLKVMEAEIGAARNATAHVREGIVARAGGQATAAPAAPPAGGGMRTATRTGTLNGRRVVQYSDGTISYAD